MVKNVSILAHKIVLSMNVIKKETVKNVRMDGMINNVIKDVGIAKMVHVEMKGNVILVKKLIMDQNATQNVQKVV
jgi:hypothetical protein